MTDLITQTQTAPRDDAGDITTADRTTAADAPSTDAPTGPVWFHRVNPFERARLRDTALATLLDDLVAVDADLAAHAESAAAELHELIGAAADEDRKPLLNLSRALRKGKRLPDGDRPPTVALWEQTHARQEALVARIGEAYAAALRTERRELARQLTDPALTASLELVAPEVAKQAARYVEAVAETGEGTSRLLKSERGLLQYVLRAAVRTSPLAQLTAVGLTHAAPGGDHPDHPTIRDARSFCSLDRVMLDYVLGGAEESAGRLGVDPTVGLPPTSAVDGGRLWFLVPSEGGYQRANVALGTPLAQIVGELAMGPVPLSHLSVAVADLVPGADAAAVAGFIRQAVERGMLALSRPTTDTDLLDLSPRGHDEVDAQLSALADALTDLETAPAPDRRALLDHADATLARVSRASGRPARIGVTEDRLLTLDPVDPTRWGTALDDLGPAVELLHTFDWLADVALALKDAFVTTHGAGARVPLTRVAPGLVGAVTVAAEAMTTAYLTGGPEAIAELGGPDSDLAHLYAVRRRVEEAVGSAFDAAVESGTEEVVLTPDQVHDLLAGMPARLRERPLSYGVLVQSTGDGLVVNDGLPGHGMLFSRFLGMDHAAGGARVDQLRRRLLDVYDEPGVRVVEDRSHHGLNVNVHPPVLADGLEPQDWSRLELLHDVATDELRVVDGDQRLTVLQLGGGHPGLYPPALSVASGLVIAGRLYNGLPDAWAAQDERDPASTRRVPRMRVGAVVINRARWYPGTDLHDALALPDEQERFVALTRWRATHGVPDEVVIKSVPADAGPASVGSPDGQAARFKAKPQYVDLTSAVCVRVLPRMLERRGGDDAPAMYLEEATPGLESGPHAAEWVVEVDRPRAGRFGYGEQS